MPSQVNLTEDSLALLWLDERSRVRQSITRHPISLCSCEIGFISNSEINNSRYSSTVWANCYFLTIKNIFYISYVTYIFSHLPHFYSHRKQPSMTVIINLPSFGSNKAAYLRRQVTMTSNIPTSRKTSLNKGWNWRIR